MSDQKINCVAIYRNRNSHVQVNLGSKKQCESTTSIIFVFREWDKSGMIVFGSCSGLSTVQNKALRIARDNFRNNMNASNSFLLHNNSLRYNAIWLLYQICIDWFSSTFSYVVVAATSALFSRSCSGNGRQKQPSLFFHGMNATSSEGISFLCGSYTLRKIKILPRKYIK